MHRWKRSAGTEPHVSSAVQRQQVGELSRRPTASGLLIDPTAAMLVHTFGPLGERPLGERRCNEFREVKQRLVASLAAARGALAPKNDAGNACG